MKDEYDFTDGQRGRFHVEGAVLIPPAHLEPDVLAFVRARAEADMALIEATG